MKKTVVLIIVIIAVLFLTGGVFAFLYLATDTFKSNKELFIKYLSQIKIENFLDMEKYEEYGNKILNENHTNEGSLSINSKKYDIDEKFDFSTKNNPKVEMASGEIKFTQSGKEKLTMEYLKNDDLYGIKCIFRQYIALFNNNLKDFVDKIGLNENEISDKIEINKEKIDLVKIENDFKALLNKYALLIASEIQDDNYIKLDKENIIVQGNLIEADGYSVILNWEEIINILKVIINTAKNDQDLYSFYKSINNDDDQSNSYESYQIIFEDIEKKLENPNTLNPYKLTISVYKQGDNLVKFYYKSEINENDGNSYSDFAIENNSTIRINSIFEFNNDNNTYALYEKQETNVVINKNKDNNKEQFDISYVTKVDNEEKLNADLVISLANTSSENIETEAVLNLNALDIDYSFKFSNNTTFVENVEIQKFSEVEYVLLSDYSEEQINKILTGITKQIIDRIDYDNTIIGHLINLNYAFDF